jgi:hypothetical protein
MKRLLRASVASSTGKARHFILSNSGEQVETTLPTSLVLAEGDGGFLLLRNSEEGVCLADTWHVTLKEAQAQAALEFGIEETDWAPVE